MNPSESRFLQIRGLRYQIRSWGREDAPIVFLLHGWMDCSASFQFFVDAIADCWRFVAPDWRGFGLTDWAPGGDYGFADYVADLDQIAEQLSPGQPLRLLGHSMGGHVAVLYAAARPERVQSVISVEGVGVRAREPSETPGHLRLWLEQLRSGDEVRVYSSYQDLAARIRRGNPLMSAECADYVARHWGRDAEAGGVVLRADPGHNRVWPHLFRLDEAQACWSGITAPFLWVHADESLNARRHHIDEREMRLRCGAVSGAESALIRGAGHMAHLEQPEQLAAIAAPFFSKHSTRP